jgi:transcriptional regulator GlxA family with amidase domain
MRRREFLQSAAAAAVGVGAGASVTALAQGGRPTNGETAGLAGHAGPLVPPARGRLPVAVLVSQGATVIDFAGPWEVFQDVHVPERGSTEQERMPFELFTVSDTTDPITASAGLKIVPDYALDAAPAPRVIVVPAQRASARAVAWLREASAAADLTMSVCTGAFVLGSAGLLAGRAATTHHDFFDQFAERFPDVELKRGVRFVEGGRIATSGGLTSGIDLALRVVERYFGRDVARRTATYMEYRSDGWIV